MYFSAVIWKIRGAITVYFTRVKSYILLNIIDTYSGSRWYEVRTAACNPYPARLLLYCTRLGAAILFFEVFPGFGDTDFDST